MQKWSTSIIHCLKGYIQSIYLVEEQQGLLLLDGLCRSDFKIVKDFIEKELKRPLSDLKYVIGTHAHPDHMGSLSEFKKVGVKVLGPVELNDWYKGLSGILTYFVDILLTYLVAFNKGKKIKNIFFKRSVELDLVLKDGDKIPSFEDWEVIKTPGHTMIDISLYNRRTQKIYIGDIFVGSNRGIFTPYPIHSPQEYINTLNKLQSLNISQYLLAHYGEVTIAPNQIADIVKKVPIRKRSHTNSLHKIMSKLFRSLFKK